MSDTQSNSAGLPRGLILLPSPNPSLETRVWGLTGLERLERGLTRLGVVDIEIRSPGENLPSKAGGLWIIVRGDLFYDERLLTGLFEQSNVLLRDQIPGQSQPEVLAAHVANSDLTEIADSIREQWHFPLETPSEPRTEPVLDDGPRTVEKLDLAPAYNSALRKFDPPFVYSAEPARTRATENHIFRASYKGITDLVTKWVWPLPAREVTRVLARRGVQPNTVTAYSYLLTVLATWCFAESWFALGLLAGWGMTFLDTVDGKLARTTLTSTRLGSVLDHALDLIHPPIWWGAWAWGVAAHFEGLEVATAIVLVGYVTGRLLEGVFLLFFKQELFTWRPFDAFFRTIIARRNPNLIVLSVSILFGRPDLGLLSISAWTLVANIVPAVRIIQAFSEQRKGVVIQSWYQTTDPQADSPSDSRSRILLSSIR